MTKELEVQDDGLNRRQVTPRGDDMFSVEAVRSIEARLRELSAENINEAAVLPRNFDSAPTLDACVFESITADLVMLGRQAGVHVSTLGGQNRRSIHEHDVHTIGATIVLVLEHAEKAAVYVEFFNLIAKYLKRRGHGAVNDQTEVVQEVIVTDRSVTRRITYRGPLSGLSAIVEKGQEALNEAVK